MIPSKSEQENIPQDQPETEPPVVEESGEEPVAAEEPAATDAPIEETVAAEEPTAEAPVSEAGAEEPVAEAATEESAPAEEPAVLRQSHRTEQTADPVHHQSLQPFSDADDLRKHSHQCG